MKRVMELEIELGIRHLRLHIVLVWLFSSIMTTVGLLGVSADDYIPVFIGVITVVALISWVAISTPIFRKLTTRVGKKLIGD